MPHALLLPCFLIAREQEQEQRRAKRHSDREDEGGRETYTRAVRDAIRGGGCNTSRAGVVGATLAAAVCAASGTPAEWLPVPLDWIAQLRDGQTLLRLARGVADLAAETSTCTPTASL